jgi:hypothetical protein
MVGMALLDVLLLTEQRAVARAQALAAEHRYDDALQVLGDLDSERAAAARHEVRAAAIDHYGRSAERAADRDDGPRAHARLARAQRFATPPLRPRYHRYAWGLRVRALSAVRAEGLVELVQRAETERRRWFEGDDAVEFVPSWASESDKPLLKRVAKAWGLDRLPRVDELLYADTDRLRAARDAVARRYPDDLAATVPKVGDSFVQAVLLLSAGRPDRAALPLAEAPDDAPIVCFERARVAHLLDLAPVARDALLGFVAHAGGHRRIGRLHTAVFLAQMELAAGQEDRALELLLAVPPDQRGRRPSLMLGRLLLDRGELEQAQDVLHALVKRAPALKPARRMLEEANRRLSVSL